MSTITSSLSSTFASNFPFVSKNIQNFDNFDLTSLQDQTLDEFFLFFDKSLSPEEKSSKNTQNLKSTDLFHYIWMDNPLKKAYQNNILKLKSLYPDKKFILWVDKLALENEKLLKFAKENNICLILLDEVFKEKYTFKLDEILKIEKNRIPPNLGALSDIYRYLISYYFAGTYLDTDRDPDTVTIFTFKKNIETLPQDISIKKCGNDIIIVKTRKNQFFKDLFDRIKNRYKNTYDYKNWVLTKNICSVKSFRLWSTIYRTGPDLFSDNDKSIYRIKTEDDGSDFGWSGTLTDILIEKLIKNKDIETNIALNIIQELKERKILNLIRYDKIIDKLPTDARRRILNLIKLKLQEFLKDNPNFEIEHLIAKNKEVYQEFITLIPDNNKKIESHFLALKKAIKTKNIEMLNFHIDFLDKEKIEDQSYLIVIAFLFDKKILNILIEALAKKNISVNLKMIFNLLIVISTEDQIKTIKPEDLEEFVFNLKNKNLLLNDFNTKDLKLEECNFINDTHLLQKIAKNKQFSFWIYNQLNSPDYKKFVKRYFDLKSSVSLRVK